jgi:osmotically inducible protein OsmC
MKRKATAVWKGAGKEGKGQVSTQSTVLSNTNYSFNSRFGEDKGTNPEELVAAAHAGCFAMKLSIVLADAGFPSDELTAECTVTFADGAIKQSHLVVKASVPNISPEKFQECAQDAKENCPISKSLSSEITMEASLA